MVCEIDGLFQVRVKKKKEKYGLYKIFVLITGNKKKIPLPSLFAYFALKKIFFFLVNSNLVCQRKDQKFFQMSGVNVERLPAK